MKALYLAVRGLRNLSRFNKVKTATGIHQIAQKCNLATYSHGEA